MGYIKYAISCVYSVLISYLYTILVYNKKPISSIMDDSSKDWLYYLENPASLLPKSESITTYNKTILIECLLKKNEYETKKTYDESMKDKFLTTIQQKLSIRDIFDNLNVGFYNPTHKLYISVYNTRDDDASIIKRMYHRFPKKHKVSVLRTSHVPDMFKLKYLYDNVCYFQTIKNKYIRLNVYNTFTEVNTIDDATQFELIPFNEKYTSWFIKVNGQTKFLCMEADAIDIGLSTNKNTWESFEILILEDFAN